MHQLNLHPRYTEAPRASAEKHYEFQTWFHLDIGDIRVVLFLSPGAYEAAQRAATALNEALAMPYPEPPDEDDGA